MKDNKIIILQSSLGLNANQSVIFKNPQEIIRGCRGYDALIQDLTASLYTLVVPCDIADQHRKILKKLIRIDDQLNDLKKDFKDLFTENVLNKDYKEWLHLEYAVTNMVKPLKSARLRWRLGLTIEKRYYCDINLLDSPNFMMFFKQENPISQQIILEFERIRIQMIHLTKYMRFQLAQFNNFKDLSESVQSLQIQYHSITNPSLEQSL